jgi:hypothetical protein
MTYQSGPTSSSWSDSCEHLRLPAYEQGTFHGCFWKHYSMGPIRFLLFHHQPVLLQGCSLERIEASRNLDGHGCEKGQFPSGDPGSWTAKVPDFSLLDPGSELCIGT